PHTLSAKGTQGSVADGVSWKCGHVHAVEAEMREAHGDIGLAAAKGGRERRRLQQALESRRAQSQHDLAERDDARRRGGHDGPRTDLTDATIRSAFARTTP